MPNCVLVMARGVASINASTAVSTFSSLLLFGQLLKRGRMSCGQILICARTQVRKPNDATLAFLLGLAVGVMATLSVVELWIKNGIENGVLPTSIAVAGGVLLYRLMQPYFPEFEV